MVTARYIPHPTRSDAVQRVMPTLTLFRNASRSNVGEFHVAVSLPRIPSLERSGEQTQRS
ncbi:MAG: hypothetical protein O9972_09645 [Burkholderiales bacterium]|nr:hypothetical protein [Burkholderiales bacterium]